MIDIPSSAVAVARVPESFIGNDKKTKPRKMTKVSAQLGRGVSAIKAAKPIKKAKTPKAWFKQIRIIYAIDFAIYGNKLHAEQVSKSYRHSFDLAKAKITQLEQTQKLKAVIAN